MRSPEALRIYSETTPPGTQITITADEYGEWAKSGWVLTNGRTFAVEKKSIPKEPAIGSVPRSPLDVQISGDHYKSLTIQPVEYIHANQIPFIEGCVIKYVSRWRNKGGLKDLEKAKHFIDLLIELETRSSYKDSNSAKS